MSRRLTACAVAALTTAACAHTEIVGRYKTATCDGADCHAKAPTVGVSLSSAASKSDAKPATFKDLPERALGRYVEALAALKPASAAELRQNLAAPIKAAPKDAPIDDLTEMERSLAVTVAKTSFNPADRLVYTQVQIRLDNAEFANWTAVKTEYETYDLGTLKSERKLSFEAAADIVTGNDITDLPKIGTTTTAEQTRNEELAAKQRVELLTTQFTPKSITITREGAMGIDLTGTTLLDVSVVPTLQQTNHTIRFTADGLTADPATKAPAKPSLKAHPTAEPNIGGAVTATVTLSCRLRHVTAGDETAEEKDDVVDFETCRDSQSKVTIVPARDAQVPAWGLMSDDVESDDHWLYAGYTNSKSAALCFSSYEEADDLLDYLEAHPSKTVGGTKLGYAKLVSGVATFTPLAKPPARLRVEPCAPGG